MKIEKELHLLVLKTIEDLLEGLSPDKPLTARTLWVRILGLEILAENPWICEVEEAGGDRGNGGGK
jgi:hypothetical protein